MARGGLRSLGNIIYVPVFSNNIGGHRESWEILSSYILPCGFDVSPHVDGVLLISVRTDWAVDSVAVEGGVHNFIKNFQC